MDYKTKLYDYIQDSVSDETDMFEKELDIINIKMSHEPIHILTQIDRLIKEAGNKILNNLNGVKYINVYYTKEWEFIDGIREKVSVLNIDRDSFSLQNYIERNLENNTVSSWNKLTAESWVTDTIAFNSNTYSHYVLSSYYKELLNNHPIQYKIYTKSLSDYKITHTDDNIKINKFNWNSNCSNLGFLFKCLEKAGYIQFPRKSVDMALENLMAMFNISISDKKSLREYLLNDKKKIRSKEKMFERAAETHIQESKDFLLKLPNKEFLKNP